MNFTLDSIKEILPQSLFIIILIINLITSLIDNDRNFIASVISTAILIGLTYWGGFYSVFSILK